MSRLKYNRPIFRHIDDNHKQTLSIAKKPFGEQPVRMSDEITFGKYKGCRLKDIPTNYLEWLVSVSDDSTALKYCRELAKRPKYK